MEVPALLDLAKRLAPSRQACSWYRCDLHVHTPASHDYKGGKPTAEELLKVYADAGVNLIAITDHHTGDFIDSAVEARGTLAAGGTHIAVIPGVELHVHPGIHYTALFPDEFRKAEIDDFLSSLSIGPAERGVPTTIVNEALPKVVAEVHKRGGLLIAAHASSDNGLLSMDGQSQHADLRSIDAMELNSNRSPEQAQKSIAFARGIHPDLPAVFSSDGHYGIPAETMWVKMYQPTFHGLRQIVFEPELRIARELPTDSSHFRVIGITTTAGLYADERFRFAPSLNVVIGGRGAGKSALLDLIRFVYEQEPADSADDESRSVRFRKRVAAFLGGAGTVVALVANEADERFLLVRAGNYDVVRGRPKFSDHTTVYRVTEDNAEQLDCSPLEACPVEFFGQGEVGLLAERSREQMRLLDDSLGIDARQSDEDDLVDLLIGVEAEMDGIQTALSELRTEAALEPALLARRKELDEALASAIFDVHEHWNQDRLFLDRLATWAAQELAWQLPVQSPTAPAHAATSGSPIIEEAATLGSDMRAAIVEFKSGAEDATTKMRTRMAELREQWEPLLREAEEQYNQALKESGGTSKNGLATERTSVIESLRKIHDEISPEITVKEARLATLTTERAASLGALRTHWTDLHNARTEGIQRLSEALPGIQITVHERGDVTQLRALINERLAGGNIQRRPEKVEQFTRTLSRDEISEVFRNRDEAALVKCGFSETDAPKVIAAFPEKGVMEIERLPIPDLPEIRAVRDGDTYVSLDDLSVGEKCSAVLTIALHDRSKPLVIDQPEDDLDHEFITTSVVNSVRQSKAQRQIITATHNPNIPVLGDAEMVFKVAKRPGEDRCAIGAQGGLERPNVTAEVQSLEGGETAFRKRGARYASL